MYSIFISLCKSRNVNTAEVSRATGIKQPTFTAWKQGKYTPKKEKLQLIADYFGVSLEYLTTGKDTPKESTNGTVYYFSDETAQIAQEIMENPNLHALFKAARGLPPKDMEITKDLIERLKGTNPNG